MSPSLEGFSDLKEDLMFEDSLDVATSHYLSDDGQADRVVMSSSDGRVINSSTVYRQIESPNAIPGDHILRPFSRREKRNQLHTQQQQQQQQQGQQIPPQPQLNPRNTNAFRRHQLSSQDFSLPVVDLKRISGDTTNRYPNNQLKRLPLMEEGFLLSPAPNSAGSLERRQDFVQEERHPVRGSRGTSSDSFRRRFGDGLAHESVNFNSNGGNHGSGEVSTGDQHHHHHHHHLRAFLEDSDDNELSLNDLDLDDIAGPMPPQQGQRGLANHPKNGHHPNHNNNHPHQQHHHSHSHNHNHHHHHTAHQQQNFKALRKPIRSAQFGGDHGSAVLPPPPPPPPPSSSAVPPSPSSSPGGGGNPAPSGAPISQIMPLFFDKFLAEFGNAHLPPLSPEGFSLPPSPASPVAPPPPPPTSSADLEASRGGGPPSSTLPGGIHLKPEIGPPLFSNDLVQPSPPPPPSSAEFGGDGGGGGSSSPAVSSGPPWPKIFRFTDGRINLHDFEREKKRSRVKFSAKLQMASKAALYNIKRESFLILHGGTFSQ
ncbi:hypothetical protein TYRP_002731 [Tyrophagus putrescentiae]|nr:hypothetical protein TYRP_002731 [Tyrophagus putrescentiae]